MSLAFLVSAWGTEEKKAQRQAYNKKRRQKLEQDPERLKEHQAKHRESQNNYRQKLKQKLEQDQDKLAEHKAKRQAAERKRLQKLKQDPKRYAAYTAKKRELKAQDKKIKANKGVPMSNEIAHHHPSSPNADNNEIEADNNEITEYDLSSSDEDNSRYEHSIMRMNNLGMDQQEDSVDGQDVEGGSKNIKLLKEVGFTMGADFKGEPWEDWL